MKLQTPVTDERCSVSISYDDRIMMLGSCFSEHIGRQLADFGFDVCINPFGTLYNPVSILHSIEMLLGEGHFTEEDAVDVGAGSGLVCSFSHHTSFACRDTGEFLDKSNTALDKAREYFRSCNKVIITLGTSWCFRHNTSGRIVSNCLKRPAAEFTRERLTVGEAAGYLARIRQLCDKAAEERGGFAEKQFIYTVSPIRHFKDGAHGNQLSKSTLLLAVDTITDEGKIEYFPAYEIVMDELRDYRFYAEDMFHPSLQTTDYIRERFLTWALPKSEHSRLEENIRAFRRSQHISKHYFFTIFLAGM